MDYLRELDVLFPRCGRILVTAAPLLACFYQPTGTVSSIDTEATANASSEPFSTNAITMVLPTTTSSSTTDVPATDATTVTTTESLTTGSSPACGDGIVDPSEGCDDGNFDDDDACSNACVPGTCGDGFVGFGEDCDDRGESPVCDADCTLPACGDAVVNSAAGEDCDDGGESITCDKDCTPVVCGDGWTNASAGEACDDSNPFDDDACTSSCAATKFLSVGTQHVCVGLEDGAVRCWGSGEEGALGQGSLENLGDAPGELPVSDILLDGPAVQLSSGLHSTCARLATNRVRCWGYGALGQLGYGDTASVGGKIGDMPPDDVDVGADIIQIAVGDRHTCAIVAGGTVRCWGYGFYGSLGYGMKTNVLAPSKLDVPGIAGAVQLALGDAYTCVLHQAGEVRCWGLNNRGQLGLGNTNNVGDGPGEIPPPVIDLGGPVEQIAAGYDHTCALLSGGDVRCWGFNNFGQLGNGLPDVTIGNDPGEMPPAVVNLGGPAIQVVAGREHSCALLATGEAKCWGSGLSGALGQAETLSISLPDQFPPPTVSLGATAARLAAHGDKFTCAFLVDGALRCWGNNDSGQLGQGHILPIGDNEKPSAVDPIPF